MYLDAEQQVSLLVFAEKIHQKQFDKSGRPYVEHVKRVANEFDPGSIEWAVGLMHDSMEDCAVTADQLLALGMTPDAVQAVELLTHERSVPYYQYIVALRSAVGHAAQIARRVKLSDIFDNMNPDRLYYLPEDKRWRMLKKYHQALKDLLL